MNKFYALLSAVLLPLVANAQCPVNNITLTSQIEIDNFNATYLSCTAPTKSISINGSSIVNLNGLSNITSIGGTLSIESTSLTDLTGLNNLTQIGGSIAIQGNWGLVSLTGLNNLVSVAGSFTCARNSIASLSGLSKLEYIGGAFDASDLQSTDLSGLEKLTHLGSLSLTSNSELTSLNGLQNAVAAPTYDNIYIFNNSKLANCTIPYICFRRPDRPGTIGSEIGNNAPSGSCSEGAVDFACLPMTLPVTLVRFDARKTQENQVALTWATSSEKNSKVFEIEKNDGRGTWFRLGTVSAQNESSQVVQYSFSDEQPSSGTNLYRLKMVDLDDTFAYSRIVAVNLDNTKINGIYPNPTAERIRLGVDDLADLVQVQIFNTSGQVLMTFDKVEDDGIDVRSLSTGMYLVNVKKKDGKNVSYKVFKNK